MKILLVAADRMEFGGMGALPVKGRAWPCPTRIGQHEAVMVANGVGAARAAAAVDAVCAHWRPDRVVSVGFCGALEAKLGIADIVVADSVLGETARFDADLIAGRAACTGAVCSIGHVAETAAEKLRLRETGAYVVEMEAAGVAARALSLGLPFSCVKAVTDLADEDMANDFNGALRSDGHFDTMYLLRSALRRPSVRLPELMRLRNRCIRAARALGDFFADCRF
jgi:nucleoside phosphorylase